MYEAAQWYLTSGRLEEFSTIVKYIGADTIDNEGEIIPEYNDKTFCLHRSLNRPLMVLASEAGLLSEIKLLIEYKYFLDIADKYGWTPLMSAAACGRIDIVKFLCSKGAAVNLKEQHGKTALHLAAQDGHNEVVNTIIQYGGINGLRCNKGKTPLDYALQAQKSRKAKTVKALDCHLMVKENRKSHSKCNIF